MKGIELPPLTEDFTADPVELFFDLAYVFAFSQLVALLINEPTWTGAGKAALLFALLWLPWQQLTWAANAISGNGRPVRTLFLIATVVSIPMAASTSTAFAGGGPVFAIALTAIMLIGFRMQTMGTTEEIDYRSAALTWIAPNVIAILVLVMGSFYDGTARLGFWLGTVAIVLWAMIKAADSEWLVRPGHFAERHGLIIIIALGEVIVAIGIPVVAALEKDGSLTMATISALLASGAFAGLLWWAYFDRPSPGLEFAASKLDGRAAGRSVHPRRIYLGPCADRRRHHPRRRRARRDRSAPPRHRPARIPSNDGRRPLPIPDRGLPRGMARIPGPGAGAARRLHCHRRHRLRRGGARGPCPVDPGRRRDVRGAGYRAPPHSATRSARRARGLRAFRHRTPKVSPGGRPSAR